ncbi:RteC domain-containing protein [Bacteroides sp. OttesenSCG-928-E20]|nr:RteC domain-containing protein [Bacteroides sp. OttesenSCG-928-N06]MDL2299986.1 RteC domain-containing protein [Bacteroides sp. OttesenSCG-928-E20]
MKRCKFSIEKIHINYEFKNEEEEIYFFKDLKQLLVSQLIYYCQVYNIELNRPIGGMFVQRKYCSSAKELSCPVGRKLSM